MHALRPFVNLDELKHAIILSRKRLREKERKTKIVDTLYSENGIIAKTCSLQNMYLLLPYMMAENSLAHSTEMIRLKSAILRCHLEGEGLNSLYWYDNRLCDVQTSCLHTAAVPPQVSIHILLLIVLRTRIHI